MVIGRYTRRKRFHGGAPSEAAARRYTGSSPFITLYSGSTTKGSSTCTIAT